MKKLLLVTLALLLLAGLAFAQTGSVSGTVRDTLNNPVSGATIELMRPRDPMHGYHAQTGADGTFSIPDVNAGLYMAEAMKMMVGHDQIDSVAVVAGQNTVIDFVLHGGHNPPPPDTLFGSISGMVQDTSGNPIGGAEVTFMQPRDQMHSYHAETANDGTYSISNVHVGFYEGEAMKMMVGHDQVDSVQVTDGQNTVVDFVLRGEHNPPPPPNGTGSVSGTVHDTLGNPVADAEINLMGGDGGDRDHRHHGGGMGMNYSTRSGADGSFSIANVAAGQYFAMAAKMMIGRDLEEITVADSQNTIVNFVLAGCDGDGEHHGGEHRGDSLQIVNLTGWAIVVTDSMHSHYFLDTNGDDTADYRLEFGPSWYNPGNGARRPVDGDSIWITGGLFGYGHPQMVVVYEINGLFWRQPGHGHGGHGGHGGGYPHPDSLVGIEATGLAIVLADSMRTHYFLDTNYDDTADYILNFGPPDYNPGNGATRPNDGDTIAIVGGLLNGWNGHLDMIIVYEINGQLWWRDPGDTLGLWPMATAIGNEETPALPNSFLVAKSYPNPFNPTAIISFDLANSEQVKVTVYDLLGREVAVLANRAFPAGQNQVQFTPSQGNGSTVYFYKVTAGDKSATGKMILLK